ncbi:hypothetical protein K6025_05285 [Ehrlichia sp. JZT12]
MCTGIYFSFKILREMSNCNQALERVIARNNIYIPFKGRREQTVEERVEILSENIEEVNQEEQHIYEYPDTLINVETCQPITDLSLHEITRL